MIIVGERSSHVDHAGAYRGPKLCLSKSQTVATNDVGRLLARESALGRTAADFRELQLRQGAAARCSRRILGIPHQSLATRTSSVDGGSERAVITGFAERTAPAFRSYALRS